MAETTHTPPRRRDTNSSQRSQASVLFRQRITKSWTSVKPASSSKTCHEQYPSYLLSREKIKGWLEMRYPDIQFNKNKLLHVDDRYIFEVPTGQNLTETERKEIAGLKEKVVETRRAVTPEQRADSDSEEDTYPTALKVWRNRLRDSAGEMFREPGSTVDIPYRDLNSGGELDKRNVFTPADFDEWLGLQFTNDPLDPSRQIVSATKSDPKCRFVYIYGENSRTHLKITKDMLTKILTYHQVMPVYLDFMSVFGEYSDQRDLRFSGFREQSSMKETQTGLVVPEAPIKNVWSIQQAAIHHQFDVIEGTTLWIITKGHLDLQQRFKELTTDMAVYGPRGQGHAYEQYRPEHIQDVQRRQDKINEIVMVLEANVDVMKSLCKFYTDLWTNRHFPQDLKDSCGEDILTFTAQVEDMMYDLKMQIARARVLLKITNDRKEIILQHLQSQSTARMERLNANMEKEAIVVRIITIVTLIYLPATFVSTFFSTDIVKYQNQNGGSPGDGNFSRVALNRWLQVTFPLTAATVLFAYTAWWIADKSTIGEEHPKAPVQAPTNEPRTAGPSRFLRLISLSRTAQQLPTHEPKFFAEP
ncbi:hypothetical protein BLS_007031 [Venturia inaequalis]|uniref:CorA-like transporter domain-containing protein n=1 Tax=Venturia inaequalis TaxID=5025 RepID=A0A8H3UBR5_VENIN|nr:hypothetical protein BLS_007031 [Venturia inaequalis]